jgi:WD40 repeat protein
MTFSAAALSACGGTTLKLWDVRLHRQLSTLENHGFVDCAALSHDGRVALAAGSSGIINVWDINSGRLIRSLDGHGNTVFSLSFGPDDRTAAAGDADGIIKLWDLATGAEVGRFPPAVDKTIVASRSIL